MIDPRFANAGAVPLVPGYGAQQIPAQYHHHHHRHHRHHKNKARNDASPVSLDESIHKVDHSQPQYFQNDGVAQGGGYGVPYGAGGFEASAAYGAAGFYPQQQYGAANFGYANQYQGGAYGQAPFVGGPGAPVTKHHRRHHRHHRHQTTEVTNVGADPAQAVPEQLIGQRSSSVLDNEQQQQQQQQQQAQVSSSGQAEASSEPTSHHKHHRRHHHRHHHSTENAGFEQTQQTQQSSSSHHHHHHHHHQATTAGSNGYGHINDDLIFIERGDHSPHRQEPPAGYEYKGKIEVQSIDRERTVQTQGQTATTAQQPNFCPPGSYPAVLTPGAAGPCPPGAAPYTGYLGAGAGGFGAGAGSFGAGGYATSAGSYATSAASYGAAQTGISGFGLGGALPPNCQVVADYVFGSGSGISTSGGQQQQVDTNVSTRATVIEVWQKRGKSETRERSHSRSRQRSPTEGGPSFDFDRFRNEILAAIERMGGRGGPSTGTQTQIHPDRTHTETEKRVESGEVRVIVQPIQPVFYMPRQTGTTTTTQPQIGPAPVGPQPAAGGAAQVVYVPRNVYVPVIKPVFVPRERVIVRPQVIHVARPVLVDRPVPVTQRPIIIDRERPIPVPVRSGGQAAQAGGSKVVREEYVYRDNLPVAYGGRCAEFAGGVNYGYMPSQQEHQYANSSTHETASIYQTQGQGVNIAVPNQFQQSTSSSHVEVQQGGAGSFHGSYSNLADVGGAAGQFNQEVTQQTYQEGVQVQCIPVPGTGVGAGGVEGVGLVPPQVEILDTAVNPFWQKTDQTTLLRRYGRPAYQIVHQSKEVEQQMYNEIRQRTSSGGVVRSASGASFGSSSGIGTVSGGGFAQY